MYGKNMQQQNCIAGHFPLKITLFPNLRNRRYFVRYPAQENPSVTICYFFFIIHLLPSYASQSTLKKRKNLRQILPPAKTSAKTAPSPYEEDAADVLLSYTVRKCSHLV